MTIYRAGRARTTLLGSSLLKPGCEARFKRFVFRFGSLRASARLELRLASSFGSLRASARLELRLALNFGSLRASARFELRLASSFGSP